MEDSVVRELLRESSVNMMLNNLIILSIIYKTEVTHYFGFFIEKTLYKIKSAEPLAPPILKK